MGATKHSRGLPVAYVLGLRRVLRWCRFLAVSKELRKRKNGHSSLYCWPLEVATPSSLLSSFVSRQGYGWLKNFLGWKVLCWLNTKNVKAGTPIVASNYRPYGYDRLSSLSLPKLLYWGHYVITVIKDTFSTTYRSVLAACYRSISALRLYWSRTITL